ncbi:MAG: hypothetical protein JKY24_05250 [Pseudomonadales bacterium]|nr:hypothetical protein [Pseudomonadales bacterium]
MKYVLIIHEVDNYPEWQKGFDRAAELRKDAGEIEYQVLKYDNEENKIVHFSKWECLDNARAFFESEKVANIRRELGVKTPEFIYLDELQRGVL